MKRILIVTLAVLASGCATRPVHERIWYRECYAEFKENRGTGRNVLNFIVPVDVFNGTFDEYMETCVQHRAKEFLTKR